MIASLAGDLRIALRSLGRTPRLFAFAVACLAAALGTATAVFAIVNGVVLRPLPFQHAPRLVAIWGVNPSRDTVKRGFSWPDTIDLGRAVRSLDGLAAMANAPAGMTLTGRGDPVQLPIRIVSGNFFEVLGVPAALGQTLTPADDVPNSQPAVTISHALWRQRFGSDAAIAGQSLTLDGRTFVVTGVAPRGFAYPPDAQMWVTIAHGVREYVDNRSVGWLEIIGRMKPGVTPDAARADLAIPLDDLTRRYYAARGREDVSAMPLQRELLARNPLTNLEAVSPGYFDTMEIPILEGRDMSGSDREGRAAVAVVSQSFVKRFWPDGRALGRRLEFPLPGSPYDRQSVAVALLSSYVAARSAARVDPLVALRND